MALGDLEGATEAGREAIAIFRELGNKAGEARVRQEISYVRWVSRDYPGALEANFEALRIHRQLGNRRGEAVVAGNIAQVYRGVGDHEQALRWAEKAARIHHELEDKFGEDIRLSTIAAIHRERGDLESALHLNLKTFNEKVGAKNLIVAQHSTCGMLYLRLGDPEKALEHFQAATRLSREIGYTRDEGYSLMSVGVALERMGDPAGAAHAYRRAVELLDAERPTRGMPQATYEESGASEELSGKVDALTLLAELLHRSLDRPEEALSTYEAAEGVCRKLNDRRRLRKLLTSQAGLRWRTGQLKKSARDYEEALDLARKQKEPASEAAALASLSVVYRDLGHLKESVRCGRAALKLLQNLSDPQAKAYVLSSLAQSYGELGHYPSALSCLRRSLRLRRRIGDKEGEVGVLEDLARIYEGLRDPGRARACSEDAASRRAALAEAHVDAGTGRR